MYKKTKKSDQEKAKLFLFPSKNQNSETKGLAVRPQKAVSLGSKMQGPPCQPHDLA